MTNRSNSYSNNSDDAPYWQDKPCPTWCVGGHHGTDSIEDAYHSGPLDEFIVLSTDTAKVCDLNTPTGPYHLVQAPEVCAYLEMHHLHATPRVRMEYDSVGGEARATSHYFTISEARHLADQITTSIALADGATPGELGGVSTNELYVRLASILTELHAREGLDSGQTIAAEFATITQDPDTGAFTPVYGAAGDQASATAETRTG